MSEPRVFVVNVPLKPDHATGRLVPAHDVSDAGRFGRLVELLPRDHDRFPADPEVTFRRLSAAMGGFTARDFLVVGLGHPLTLAWAVAIAARRAGGRPRLLYWHRVRRAYVPATVAIYQSEEDAA